MREHRYGVGLDFGTTTTLVAAPGGVTPLGHSQPWMPSLIAYADDGSLLVGESAGGALSGAMVRSIKQAITQRRDFIAVDTPTGVRDVRVDDLIVELLREAVRRGIDKGVEMTRKGTVRLGCPAMWDGRQRRRLVDSAQRAGLPVTLASLVDEPVAAGIAWLAARRGGAGSQPLRVVVFDMGGGTLDIAVLDVRGDNYHDVSVLAALSAAEAGDALDAAIAEDLDYVLGAAGIDIDSLPWPDAARESLVDAARAAKIGLSAAAEHTLGLPHSLFGNQEIWYTRKQLNAVFAPQLDRAQQYLVAALRAARLMQAEPGTAYDLARTPVELLVADVDVVLLSGGMSQIPYVRQRLELFFPARTEVELAADPPENAVAMGLANAAHYGKINMYRPAFDIRVEWSRGRHSRTVYEAFTPLVESRQVVGGGSDLRFVRTGADLSLPRKRKGRLRVVSHSGEKVHASIDGASLDGFPVMVSEQDFEFSIYPNGRIRVVDAAGTYEGQVADWHTVQPVEAVPAPAGHQSAPV